MSDALKAEGNKAFAAKDYPTAMYVATPLYSDGDANESPVRKFTEAIAVDPENHILFSNRSAVYAAQAEYQKALEDAEKSISIKPDWSKSHLRKGAAYRGHARLA